MAAPTGLGETPVRKFRAPDAEWESAKAVAASNGETVTDVLRRALRDYVEAAKPVRKGGKR
jgi:hypothetical protein